MKHFALFSPLVVLCLVVSCLTGCSGIDSATLPDVHVPGAQGSVGAIQGNLYGGHAPIVGAHVFVLEAQGGGYAGTAKSLLSASSTATSGTYPVAQDTTTGSATNGLYYVTTGPNGEFSITGDYTCDIATNGVGYPVYLYASAGQPGGASLSITAADPVQNSNGSYTITFTANNLLAVGQQVTLSSMVSTVAGDNDYALLNGTQTVTAATVTTFAIAYSGGNNLFGTKGKSSHGDSATGSALVLNANNPAVINLAMLGNCPGTKDFTASLKYVYVNEVSTVAMAYAMGGFGTDGLHIGSSSTGVTGLQNAAVNANSLYDVQGGNLGQGTNGEGHVARSVTPAGNGTVPQATLDTLANVLASCVDSANTATSTSSSCSPLFAAATSTGASGGTVPKDIATAAFNVVHHPGTTNVVGLYNDQGTNPPFSPALAAAPNDFTVAITYNNITTPSGIAIDATGDAYVSTTSTASYVTKLSPTGAVLATSGAGGNGFNSLAIDPAGNVWATAGNTGSAQGGGLYEFTGALGTVTGSPFSSALDLPAAVAVDSSGYVYVADGGYPDYAVAKFNDNATAYSSGCGNSCNGSLTTKLASGNTCTTRFTSITLDASGYFWTSVQGSNEICRITPAGGATTFGGNYSAPGNIAIDGSGNGWMPVSGQTSLVRFSATGTATVVGINSSVNQNCVQGGLSSPTYVAIDGLGNAWLTNTGTYSISEFSNAGTPITGVPCVTNGPTTSGYGYQKGSTGLNNPSGIAVDGSGDVWIANKGGNDVMEMIGAASPVSTPLSLLKPGTLP